MAEVSLWANQTSFSLKEEGNRQPVSRVLSLCRPKRAAQMMAIHLGCLLPNTSCNLPGHLWQDHQC